MELGFAHGPLRALGEISFRSGIRRVANHGLVQHLVTLVQGSLDDTPHPCRIAPSSSTSGSSLPAFCRSACDS